MSAGIINVVNVASTIPLTPGSFVSINSTPGIAGATIQISGTYQGQLNVYACLDTQNPVQVNNLSIVNVNTGVGGLAANATGIYTIDVPAGNIYVYASAWTSGAALVTISAGASSGANPGAAGGGENVNVLSLPTLAGTGSIASANGTLILSTPNGYGTLTFQTTGGWTGAVTISASMDGVTYYNTTYAAVTSGGLSTTFSTNTMGQINTSGFNYVKFTTNSGFANGPINFIYSLSYTVSNVMLDNALPAGSNTIGGVTVTGPKWTLTPNVQGNNVLQVKASAGTLGAFQAYSRAGTVSYIFLYDSLSASGTVIDVFPLYANGAQEVGTEYFGPAGYDFATGIYIAISTSNTSYVAATAANYDIGSKAK